MESLKTYTVVGLYAENHQVLCEWIEAENPEQAAQIARESMYEYGGDRNEADCDDHVLCIFAGQLIDLWANHDEAMEAYQP